jgi:DNA-binding CsgD family transcriptional regulator
MIRAAQSISPAATAWPIASSASPCSSYQAAVCAEAASREFAARGAQHRVSWTARPQALVLEARGQRAHALATMVAAWDECSRLGITVEYPALGAGMVRLAMADGDVGRARQAASAVADVASRNDVSWLRGAALQCQGLAAEDVGLLDAAVEAFTRGTRPLDLALASEDAATAFVKRGDAEESRRLLGQAISIYERLGATRDLARADAVLRQAGIRRGIRGARNRPEFGWDSLTPTELTVVGLVADGLSNPQIGERLFISRRTVQAHLAHVFAKLGISARTQLAAEVARRRLGTTASADG